MQSKPSKSIELPAAMQFFANILHIFDKVNKITKMQFLLEGFQKKNKKCIATVFFFIVVVANSLYFFIFASYLQQKPLKNEENIAICKLFATKTIKKYRISCCNAIFCFFCNSFANLPAKIAFL